MASASLPIRPKNAGFKHRSECNVSVPGTCINHSERLVPILTHPAIVGAIFLLLVNDHILKKTVPSFITGKLSDFAGLFFFPFLIAVLIQEIARILKNQQIRITSYTALLAGLICTASIFSALKLSPAFNELVANNFSKVLGLPIRFVLDPTDLLATLAFIPAWLIFKNHKERIQTTLPAKLPYIILSLGALASLATGPCQPGISVEHLSFQGNALYASASAKPTGAINVGYISKDQGQTWSYEEKLPLAVRSLFLQPVPEKKTLCDPNDLQVCFRISDQPMVASSEDGGQTWHIAWQILPGRDLFMRRLASGGILQIGCSQKVPNTIPFDMTFVPSNEGSILIAAMGNEGLLIHSQSKGWLRVAFMDSNIPSRVIPYTSPTPFKAASLGEAFSNILPEFFWSLLACLIILLALIIRAWHFLDSHGISNATRSARWIFRPLWLLAAWLCLICISIIGIFRLNSVAAIILTFLNSIITWAFPFGLVIIGIIIWRRAAALTSRRSEFYSLGWLTFTASVGVLAFNTLCFVLWALDIISSYGTALGGAIGVSILILFTCVRQIRKITKVL